MGEMILGIVFLIGVLVIVICAVISDIKTKRDHALGADAGDEKASTRKMNGEVVERPPLQMPPLSKRGAEKKTAVAKQQPISDVVPKKAKSDIIWTEEYERAKQKLFAPVDEEPIVFVTGPAGVGKSILMRKLEEAWRNRYPSSKIAKLAPTGVAAVHIEGRTIHSFFIFNPSEVAPKSEVAENFRGFFSGQKHLSPTQIKQVDDCRHTGLLLVDEISMVRPDLIDSMDAALRCLKRSKAIFGGCKVVFFGDLGQLPPIYKEEWERRWFKAHYGVECPYFFEAKVFKGNPRFSPICWPVHLTRVFRQDDVRFVAALQRLRCGEMTDEDVELFDSRYDEHNIRVPARERTTLFCRNVAVNNLNNACLAELPGPTRSFRIVVTGEAGKFDPKRFKYQEILTLAIGARVMILKNGLPDYHNGTVGIVTFMQDDRIGVRSCMSGGIFVIERDTVEFRDPSKATTENERRKGGPVVGSYSQFPLKLAWAVTIHKCQGQTFDDAYIDVSGNFAMGHVYTAFSRVRSLDGLHLLTAQYLPTMPIPGELRVWLTAPLGSVGK
jgi:hypothetical protein